MDAIPIVIANMATKKDKVKELDWLEELCYFHTTISELILKLTSTIKCNDLLVESRVRNVGRDLWTKYRRYIYYRSMTINTTSFI